MDKKNYLIITTTFPKSKDDAVSARFVFDLARSLTKHYNVHVMAPSSPGAKNREDMGGVIVHRFRYFFPNSLELLNSGNGILPDLKKNIFLALELPFFFVSELISTAVLIKKEKIDIVNSHWIFPQGFICALIKKMGYKNLFHVTTPHAADVFLLKRWGAAGRRLAGFIIKNSDLILPVSTYIKYETERLAGVLRPYEVLPMGADTDKFRENADKNGLRSRLGFDDVFTFLFVGKFVEKKGIPFLIQAARIIKDKNISFKLVLIGGGPLEGEVKDMVNKFRLNQEIRLLGWVKNDLLPDIYSASDVVIVPSVFDKKGESEGMPVVINEAMACGVPVIASTVSGIPDIVKDNENGWLTEPADAHKLAAKMEKAAQLNDFTVFKRNALETARNNSYANLADKYYAAIESRQAKRENGEK